MSPPGAVANKADKAKAYKACDSAAFCPRANSLPGKAILEGKSEQDFGPFFRHQNLLLQIYAFSATGLADEAFDLHRHAWQNFTIIARIGKIPAVIEIWIFDDI